MSPLHTHHLFRFTGHHGISFHFSVIHYNTTSFRIRGHPVPDFLTISRFLTELSFVILVIPRSVLARNIHQLLIQRWKPLPKLMSSILLISYQKAIHSKHKYIINIGYSSSRNVIRVGIYIMAWSWWNINVYDPKSGETLYTAKEINLIAQKSNISHQLVLELLWHIIDGNRMYPSEGLTTFADWSTMVAFVF